MKKTILYFLVFAIIMITLSCNNIAIESKQQFGTIVIKLPENSTTRTIINVDYASSATDIYEVAIFNETDTISAILNGKPISVPKGTYSIVVFAGKEESSTTRFMLGSAYVDSVEVIQDQRTDVEITLQRPDITLTAPTEIVANRNYELKYFGILNNPKLKVDSGGSYNLDVGGSSQTAKYFGNGNINSDSFEFIESLTSPLTPMLLKVSISYVKIVIPSTNFTSYWYLPNYYYTKLDGISEITLNIIEDPTGIGITIKW